MILTPPLPAPIAPITPIANGLTTTPTTTPRSPAYIPRFPPALPPRASLLRAPPLTPVAVQIPGYLEKAQLLKAEGIDEVIVFCVNDAAVMKAWSEQQGVSGDDSIITMMGDPASEVTQVHGTW